MPINQLFNFSRWPLESPGTRRQTKRKKKRFPGKKFFNNNATISNVCKSNTTLARRCNQFLKQSLHLFYRRYFQSTIKLIKVGGGRHSSVVSSAPTILRPRVRIPSTPSMLFSICIIEIVSRK